MRTGGGGLAKADQEQSGSRTGRLDWWFQFPPPLREVALVRLIGSIGAGGVLYLTPLVFHLEAFSASSVTQGLALAALAGTLGRFVSGVLLDRGLNCRVPVLLACGMALLADSTLVAAREVPGYIQGQLLLGVAMGLYWPAIELAIPLACASGARPIPSARGYALARTADAAGIAAGALLGALLAAADHLRTIYAIDMACLAVMTALLLRRPLPDPPPRNPAEGADAWRSWLPPLLPVLAITLLATALPALMQSALPLDLVRGGLERGALPESGSALLIGVQLGLLLLLQWPVGQALARRPVATGLGLSLLSYALGSTLLALSALSPRGALLILAAQLPLALGSAAFLPIATETLVRLSPARQGGLAMAVFSQCFAITALLGPLLAGVLLDGQRHGAGLWLGMAALCLAGLALLPRLARAG